MDHHKEKIQCLKVSETIQQNTSQNNRKYFTCYLPTWYTWTQQNSERWLDPERPPEDFLENCISYTHCSHQLGSSTPQTETVNGLTKTYKEDKGYKTTQKFRVLSLSKFILWNSSKNIQNSS